MAGGTFVSTNKIRPGAYINFKSVPKPMNSVGNRGIATMPVTLSWCGNDEIIPLYSTDLSNGKCIDKIGYYGYEPEVQVIREALKNCYLVLLYKINSNGKKSNATLGSIVATAKYEGIVGNNISVVIKELGERFEVITYLYEKEKDRQIGSAAEEIKSNSWVDFTGTGPLAANAGSILTGGTDGTISKENYSKYLELVKSKVWNTMGVPTATDTTIKQSVVDYIKELREVKGKKVQAVLNDYSQADYEGIISVDQGYKTIDEEVSVDGFVGYVTGATAGADLNKSNTYSVIDGAVSIVNPKTDDELEQGLIAGKMMLSYRQDESVVIESDINTFTSVSANKGNEFSKNRVIRTLDDINNSIKSNFENKYIGKVDNNATGRNIFKADILSYFNELNRMGAISDFKTEDINISEGNDINSVIVDLSVQPVDAMEKLYMTVTVD
ncbi:phage tail sheath family protein [Clostridium paraputrificum]|uniref:phage tail sheath family protein n=1 Tax=Clostridium paraputrificum TaxID=29363 RepID=UPI003D34C95C